MHSDTELPVILPAEPGDLEAILALQKRAFHSEAVFYDDFDMPPMTQTLEQIREEASRRTVLKLVEGATILGSARGHYNPETRSGYIGRLVVEPGRQGQGLGTRPPPRLPPAPPGSGPPSARPRFPCPPRPIRTARHRAGPTPRAVPGIRRAGKYRNASRSPSGTAPDLAPRAYADPPPPVRAPERAPTRQAETGHGVPAEYPGNAPGIRTTPGAK